MSALSPDGRVHLSSGSWGTISEYTRIWVLSTALYSLWSESKRQTGPALCQAQEALLWGRGPAECFSCFSFFISLLGLVFSGVLGVISACPPCGEVLTHERPLVSSGRGSLSSEGNSLGCSGRWH